MNTITPICVNRDKYKGINNLSNRKSKNPGFKGAVPPTIISQADRTVMNVFKQHYGNIGNRVGDKLGKLYTEKEIFKLASRFDLEKGITSIKEKSKPRAILENILFPFINLPLYAASWVAKQAQKIPALSKKASEIYKSDLLRVPRKLNELDAETDIISGMYKKTSEAVTKFAKERGLSAEYVLKQLNHADDTPEAKQLVKEASEYVKENLYKIGNKFFDKYTGNFNTAYERPLNRIVTGLIPVAFLANDAYNLSVLCGDKKEDSTKEANDRTKQEITRVMLTAYIQLLTFGAFTKQVNNIPWFTPLTSAATVLLSEIVSRKRLGKPIFFLSKEQAKEKNRANKKNTGVKNPQTTNNPETNKSNQPINVSRKYISSDEVGNSIFASFKASTPDNNKATKSVGKADDNKKEQKALMNFDTFKKGVAILISAGFIISFIKNSSLTKNSKLVKLIKDFGKMCSDKIYKPLAFKDFEISEIEFKNIMSSLNDVGCRDVAKGHEFVKGKYEKVADNVIKMYKAKLSSSGVNETVREAIKYAREIQPDITNKELKQIEQAIRTAIKLESTSLSEMKYTNVAREVLKIATKKGVNLDQESIKSLHGFISKKLAEKSVMEPIQIETKLKPFVDIVTEPFKFVFSAMKLPFKLISSLIGLLITPLRTKVSEAAIGDAELTKVEEKIKKVLTEIYGEKFVEKQVKNDKLSQVVFANAMEQLQKKTLPYRNAKQAYEALQKSGKEEEKQAAFEALKNAKHELELYVNRAIEKSFNSVTQSNNKNTDLAMMSKLASSTVTSAFLVADNYNMVMLKSDGEDKEGAKEKANERIIQRLSALFYQALFINWFNATFRSTYNSSLLGMTSVAIPNTLTTEVLTRKSIGMPIGRKTLEELNEIDEQNEKRTGFAGKYFKFMRLLTGKKPLKDRLPKNKVNESNIQQINSFAQKISTDSTNFLDMYSKNK